MMMMMVVRLVVVVMMIVIMISNGLINGFERLIYQQSQLFVAILKFAISSFVNLRK